MCQSGCGLAILIYHITPRVAIYMSTYIVLLLVMYTLYLCQMNMRINLSIE